MSLAASSEKRGRSDARRATHAGFRARQHAFSSSLSSPHHGRRLRLIDSFTSVIKKSMPISIIDVVYIIFLARV